MTSIHEFEDYLTAFPTETNKYSDIVIITYKKEDGQDINRFLKENTDKNGKKLKTNNFNNDKLKIKDEGINIMTYYKCKCLEYKIVLLYDFQEWYYVKNENLDICLKYVGVTRAKEQLYMYYNKSSNYGKAKESKFIKKIPHNLYNTINLSS